MRALLLSAYDATSHARWHRGLTKTLGDVDWTVLTLPPRHFRWRTRGNPLWWSLAEPKLRDPYDVVIATSMVDLSTLIGLVPELHAIRKIAYFHENQFEYPTRTGDLDMDLAIGDLYTALAADVVLFNSAFNRDSMLDGIGVMMSKLPDYTPKNVAETVAGRARVIPVGLEDVWFVDEKEPRSGPLRIVWNHRWEYDKAPDRFFDALRQLVQRGVDFRVDVVGQQFRTVPRAFTAAKNDLGAHIDRWGWLDDVEEYRALLRQADVVVSTALHEFQGLAVLEATASGALPVVPNRLAYPNFLPEWCLYEGSLEDSARDATRLAEHLTHVARKLDEHRAAPPVDVKSLRWEALRTDYADALSAET